MIILLGGSGYVGRAFQRQFGGLRLPFRSLARKEVDYTEIFLLADLLAEAKASFVVNAGGYTGKPNVDACELEKAACLFGNAVLPGRIREACERTGTPWGHVSSGCIYTGASGTGTDGGFREGDAPNFSVRTNHCSFYSGTKALGEEVLAGAKDCFVWRLRIPFNEVESRRNYLTKVMRYARMLEAANSLSQPDEFVRACFETWQSACPPARTTSPIRGTSPRARCRTHPKRAACATGTRRSVS